MDSTFRLIPPEKMAEKILKQKYGETRINLKLLEMMITTKHVSKL